MASFIDDLNLDEAQEYKSAPEGEYQLRIMSAERKQKDKGPFIMLKLQIMGDDPFLKDITHIMMLPQNDDEVKTKNNRKLSLKRFMEAFDLDVKSRIDLDTWVGQTGWAFLVEETSDEYGTNNRIRRVIERK